MADDCAFVGTDHARRIGVTPGRARLVSLPLPIPHQQLTPPFGSPFTIPIAAKPADLLRPGSPPAHPRTTHAAAPPHRRPHSQRSPLLYHRPPAVPPRSHRELQPSAPSPTPPGRHRGGCHALGNLTVMSRQSHASPTPQPAAESSHPALGQFGFFD